MGTRVLTEVLLVVVEVVEVVCVKVVKVGEIMGPIVVEVVDTGDSEEVVEAGVGLLESIGSAMIVCRVLARVSH
jgi:hypothetical protein